MAAVDRDWTPAAAKTESIAIDIPAPACADTTQLHGLRFS